MTDSKWRTKHGPLPNVVPPDTREWSGESTLLFTDTYGKCRRCGEHFGPDRARSWVNGEFCSPCVSEVEEESLRRKFGVGQDATVEVDPVIDTLAAVEILPDTATTDPDPPAPRRRRRRSADYDDDDDDDEN